MYSRKSPRFNTTALVVSKWSPIGNHSNWSNKISYTHAANATDETEGAHRNRSQAGSQFHFSVKGKPSCYCTQLVITSRFKLRVLLMLASLPDPFLGVGNGGGL